MFQYTKAAAATMWLLGGGGGGGTKKDDSESSSSKHSFASRGSRRSTGRGMNHAGKKNSAPSRRRPRKSKISNDEEATSQTTVDKECSVQMMSDDVYSGIEVSLSNDAEVRVDPRSKLPRSTDSTHKNGVIKLRDQLVLASKVHRAHFSLVNSKGAICTLPSSPTSTDVGSNDESMNYQNQAAGGTRPSDFQHCNHRLPLFQSDAEKQKSPLLFDDMLFLLRSHSIADEKTCVDDELVLMNEEIAALESDRLLLENMVDVPKELGSLAASTVLHFDGRRHETAKTNTDWDCFSQLLVTTGSIMSNNPMTRSQSKPNQFLTPVQRTELQQERGLNLSFHLPSSKAHEALLAKCGCKASMLRKPKANTNGNKSSDNSATCSTLISPQNCRDGGAAATIQHVALWKSGVSSSGKATTGTSGGDDHKCSFFISRDTGKSFCHGHLPDRLWRRMQKEKQVLGDSQRYSEENLLYLSSGPWGSYYASFRSGECWWGCAMNESDKGTNDIDVICREWDIYRIAFGVGMVWDDGRSSHSQPAHKLQPHHGGGRRNHHRQSPIITLSWIVVGRDGRVAWKNVPSRLHNLLSSRVATSSSPIEVALGYGDAYFIKFLDGTTDWQLPAKMAHVCQQLEREGRVITSVSLNSELPHAFVIRHR